MRISDWSSDVCSSDLQRIGLRAVQQAQRNAGVGRMEQRALSFDEVPAAIVARRRDPFGGTGNEIRHHRTDRHAGAGDEDDGLAGRSEEHTSELQSLMRNSYAVFCLKKKKTITT